MIRGSTAWFAALAIAATSAIAVLGATRRVAAGPAGEVVRVEHRDPSTLPSRGPVDAPVTIEVFFTPSTNTASLPAFRLLDKLQAAHPARIRLVYRLLDGGGGARLHYAALEANAQGKFAAFIDALGHRGTYVRPGVASIDSQLTDVQLVDIARKLGMDTDRLLGAIHHPPRAYEQAIAANKRRQRRTLRGFGAIGALFNGEPSKVSLNGPNDRELEHEYVRVLEDHLDRVERGEAMSDVLDNPEAPSRDELAVRAGALDDDPDAGGSEAPLATPSLDLHGMPALGTPDAPATIVVMCHPISSHCDAPTRAATTALDLYPESVRIVWAPWFALERDDAAELALLGDAALCAEQVGTSSDNSIGSASPGWLWVEAMRLEARSRRRHTDPEQLIDKVARRLGVDAAAFATCRARIAGQTIAWIEAARRAGARASPSTVVGGRIYPSLVDQDALQQLVEVELAPGVLGKAVPTPGARL